MAQLSKCLPHKHEDLSLDPRTHIKVGCMPVTPVLEGERHREIIGACWPVSQSRLNETPCLQIEDGKGWSETPDADFQPPWAHALRYIYAFRKANKTSLSL